MIKPIKFVVAALVLAVASCVIQAAPAASMQVATAASPTLIEVCDASVEYAAMIHDFLQQGVEPDQIVKIHLNVLKESSQGVHPDVVQMTNELVALTISKKYLAFDVLQPELVIHCKSSLTKALRKFYI